MSESIKFVIDVEIRGRRAYVKGCAFPENAPYFVLDPIKIETFLERIQQAFNMGHFEMKP